MPAAVGSAAGLLLGHIYFALLWLSVERLVIGNRPLGAAATFVLRAGAAISVFLLLATWNAAAALGGLAGFTLARYWLKARVEVRLS
jgi:F1F0 ATPase subunit 2